MKNLLAPLLGLFVLMTVPAPAADDDAPSSEVHKLQWPRTFQDGTTTLMIYQPDIEKWDGNAFESRAAVSVQTPDQQAPTFGVIWLAARADVDKDAGIVTLSDIKVTKSNFPTEPAKAADYLAAIQRKIPAKPILIPLAQIDNSFLLSNAVKTANAQPVKNAPPQIIFSDKPALLLIVNGDPVFRAVDKTGYNRVFNTNALILQKPDGGPIFAKALGRWYSSEPNFQNGIAGPWSPVATTPQQVVAAGKAVIATKQVDPLDPPDGKAPTPAPLVYVSTVPTELVQTDGTPQFVPIEGTNLLEVKNSANAIILNIDDQSYYVLISGRWFKSQPNDKNLAGPWAFVDGKSLPPDFAKIPPDSSKGNVLVSVPGTPEAQEAVIANSIPQTATVKRSEAKLTVQYDGQPDFKPIEETQLQYAVNTATPVIEVSPQSFFAVNNGVWFTAPAPAGPWTVATSVPPVIYTIPASSPVHYVTYVRVYGSTPEVVYVGYTPGYYGTVVTSDGTVVYGTGYYYPPYVGTTVYVAPPATYGYGAGFADGSATGFAFGFVAGIAVGALLEPNWGCWGWHGGGWGNTYNVNINNGNIYNHWGNTAVVNHYSGWKGNTYANGTRGAAFNPYTGNWAAGRTGSAYNPTTGRGVSGTTTASGNAATGNWNANQSRSFNNDQTGAHAQSNKTASGNAYNGTYNSTTTRSGETGNGTKAAGVTTNNNGNKNHTGAAYNPNTGKGAVWHDGNVYTGNDGNVYKKGDDGNWQNYDKSGGWQNAQRNSANEHQFQNLDRQSQGWQRGNESFQQRGGGAARGGGGFERGGGRGGRR